jgi:hypothetical protein
MDETQVTTIGLSNSLVIAKDTLNGYREKSLGQTHLFDQEELRKEPQLNPRSSWAFYAFIIKTHISGR